MSNVVRFDVYGSRPVTAADVEAAFGGGAGVVSRLGSSFRARVGECAFELRGYPSVDDEGFVGWFAARRGRAGYAALHCAEVDGAYLDPDRYGGLGERVRAGFEALAERIGGTLVVVDEGAGEYADPVSGDVYAFSQAKPPAGGGRAALALSWFGIVGAREADPLLRWVDVCRRGWPGLSPAVYRDEVRRPLTDGLIDALSRPGSQHPCPSLLGDRVFGEVDFSLATTLPEGSEDCVIDPVGFYRVSCRALVSTVERTVTLAGLRDFFTTVSQQVRAELAVCQAVNGYTSDRGLAQWAPGADATDIVRTDRDSGVVLGLPVWWVWWVWLGNGYAQAASGFLSSGARRRGGWCPVGAAACSSRPRILLRRTGRLSAGGGSPRSSCPASGSSGAAGRPPAPGPNGAGTELHVSCVRPACGCVCSSFQCSFTSEEWGAGLCPGSWSTTSLLVGRLVLRMWRPCSAGGGGCARWTGARWMW